MAGFHSFIGYPWIIDYIAKYENAGVQQKPVPGQVVEFLRMPDCSVTSENCQYPEAVINISDQKYYIRAVITKEAQQMLESEDEHFTLADIKNKIIILKKFSLCFTAVEDLSRCEFYLTVQHFSVLPMETNTVDILNCNMEPGVRKKIMELWQNYMTELEMNKTSQDMNLSDVSLTQLLIVASEEKFSALKSIAEQCLELDPYSTQDILPQGRTFWSIEKQRNQENTERFAIPVDLLRISPHEEAVLESITECRYDGQCTSELADSSEGDNFSQPFSTALSTLSEETVDEGTSSQSGNPWNKLQSLCVSVATSYDSQPKCSTSVNELGSDPDSSTPDLFTSHADVSMDDSPNGKRDISPLMFPEHSSIPQQPSTSIADSASNNTSPTCRQGPSVNSSIASLSLIPLTQDSVKDSLQRSFSVGCTFQISPRKSHMSEIKSSPAKKGDLYSLSDESDRDKCWSLTRRKALKRKQTLEDLESTHSDLEQQEPEYVERPDCVTTTVSSCEEIDKISDIANDIHTAVSRPIWEREAAIPVSGTAKNNRKTEQCINTHITQNHKSSGKRIQAHKPSLQFVVNPKILTNKDSANEQLPAQRPTPSKVCNQAPPNATQGQSSFQAREKSILPNYKGEKTKLAHHDGTPFQYKYKPPSEELCTHVNAIKIPTDLCEWAVKFLSEGEEKVL